MSPTITATKAMLTVNATNSKDLTCTGTARPAPTMKWSKGSTSIVAASGNRYTITEGQANLDRTTGLTSVSSTLQISNTIDSDRGIYTCTATSPKTVMPKSATTTVKLVVNGKSGISVTVT